jgi:hypothetical protein
VHAFAGKERIMLEGIKNWIRRREEEKKKARRTAVTEFAAAFGLSYSETDRNVLEKLGTVSIESVLLPDGSLGKWPGWAVPENMLSGRWQGLPVAEADFSILATSSSPLFTGNPPTPAGRYLKWGEKRFSAAIADLPAALPDLMIQKTMTGWLGDRQAQVLQAKFAEVISRTPRYHIESGFDREWWVTTTNTALAAKLIDASMITWLLSLSAGGAFIFKLCGRNLLLVWSYLLPAPDLGAIFDTAKSFTDHIPRQIWAEYGTS